MARSAGNAFSLASMNDGAVWAWGSNLSGQLGNPVSSRSTIPVKVLGLAGAVEIPARLERRLARLGDGAVRNRAAHSREELGSNLIQFSPAPVFVAP